jgi:hypothetical protein
MQNQYEIIISKEEIDLKKTSCPNCENEIKIDESIYTKLLADAKEEFEEIKKDYEDRLASKELDNIVLKVKLENLEEKSSDVIDDVIERTQDHMLTEVTKYKKEHELRVAKILSEAKEYLRLKSIEKENEITELKKVIESISLKAETIQRKKNLEITELKKVIESISLKVEAIQGEKNLEIAKLRKEMSLNISAALLESEKIEKQKADDISLKKEDTRIEEGLPKDFATEVQKMLSQERKKNELENKVNQSSKPKIPKAAPRSREPINQKATPHSREFKDSKGTTYSRELKDSKSTLHSFELKEPIATSYLSEHISPKATPHLSEQKKQKATSHSSDKKGQQSSTTLAEFIRLALIIGGNILFIFVIYPNIANWVESAGLNNLPITIRILITMFGIMISLFCLVRSREYSSKRAPHRQRKKEGHSLKFLLGIILAGVVLLIVFLFSSNFLFFLIGTILITLAGILVINHGKYRQAQKNVRRTRHP